MLRPVFNWPFRLRRSVEELGTKLSGSLRAQPGRIAGKGLEKLRPVGAWLDRNLARATRAFVVLGVFIAAGNAVVFSFLPHIFDKPPVWVQVLCASVVSVLATYEVLYRRRREILGPAVRSGRQRSQRLEELMRRTWSPRIPTQAKLQIDGLVVFWIASRSLGLPAANVRVKRIAQTGMDERTGLSPTYTDIVGQYWAAIEEEIKPPNKDKVWIATYRRPQSDRGYLDLEVRRTNYFTTKSLEHAFTHGLGKQFEASVRLEDDLPNIVVPSAVIITSDDHMIITQRKRRETDFADGQWSVSFEEQWDYHIDKEPHDAVIRGLSEEFNINHEHDVLVERDHIRLLGFGREWGQFWNVILLYVVLLPASARTVIDCWNSMPPPIDKNEHGIVAAIPLQDAAGRAFLLNLLDRASMVDEALLERICGPTLFARSFNSDGVPHGLHATTGRARVLLGLWAAGFLD